MTLAGRARIGAQFESLEPPAIVVDDEIGEGAAGVDSYSHAGENLSQAGDLRHVGM